MLRALTRVPSPAISACQLTCLPRTPIDFARLAAQHRAYEEALMEAGCELAEVPAAPDCPDGVFVEDCAVVLDTVAVLTRPGAAARRAEVDPVGGILSRWRELVRLEAPATLDGGDVLRRGRILYVGRSSRSNAAGVEQLGALAAADGLEVRPVEVHGALHLKTAVTAIAPDTLLLNPDWVDRGAFGDARILEVAADEPFSANTLRVADTLLVPAAHPRAAGICAPFVPRVRPVEVDEIARAEGGLTCCSILVESET